MIYINENILREFEKFKNKRSEEDSVYAYDARKEMIVTNLSNRAHKYLIDREKETTEDAQYSSSSNRMYTASSNRRYSPYSRSLRDRRDYFMFYKAMHDAIGITNVQPYIVKNEMDAAFSYAVYLFGSKKANKLMMRLAKLSGKNMETNNGIITLSDMKFDMTDEINKLLLVDPILDPDLNKPKAIKTIFETLKNHKFQDRMDNYKLVRGMYSKSSSPGVNWYETYRYNLMDGRSYTRMANNRCLRLVTDMDYQYLIQLLDIMISRGDIDLHDFLESFSTGFFKNIKGDLEYQSFVLQFIRRLKDVKREDFMSIMEFMNYKRVNRAKNITIMKDNIAFIMNARRGLGYKKTIESAMLFDDDIYIKEFKDGRELKEEIIFTKDTNEINTIGSRTLCCFKPGGLASSLVKVASQSPLSGILEGIVKNEQDRRMGTWFSFVWEMLDIDENNLFRSSLILDNVEASTRIPFDKFKYYVDEVYNHSNYNQIYLGTSRNDIDLNGNMGNYDTINRPRTLINYEGNFRSYHYDDSRDVYDVSKILDLNATPKIQNIHIRRVEDDGWFHRVQAVEKLIWGNNRDEDLKKITLDSSPTYVITGDEDVILGYLITRLIIVRENEEGEFISDFKYLTLNDYRRDLEDNEHYGLLFEDLYMASNPKVVKCLLSIIEDLKDYIEVNKIKFSSASPNVNSNNFIKRLKEYTTYIPDERFGSEIEDHVTPSYTNRKISNNVFSKKLTYINELENIEPINIEERFKPKDPNEAENNDDFSFVYN